MDEKDELSGLWARYREACLEPQPSANFMPDLWARIEARREFWPAFEHLARLAMAVCALVCAVLLLLNVAAERRDREAAGPTYVDALLADQTPEATSYAETVRVSSVAWERSR